MVKVAINGFGRIGKVYFVHILKMAEKKNSVMI